MIDVTFFMEKYGPTLILSGLLILIVMYGIAYLSRFFKFLKIKGNLYIGDETFNLLEICIMYVIAMITMVSIVFMFSRQSQMIHDDIWENLRPHLPDAFLILFFIFLGAFFAMIVHRGFIYLRGGLHIKPNKVMKPRMGQVAELVIKYLIYFITFVAVLVIFANDAGLLHNLYSNTMDFASQNLGSIVLIIATIFIAYILYLFLYSFIDDLRLYSKAHRKRLASVAQSAFKVILILLVGLILAFITLNMFSLPNVSLMLFAVVALFVIVATAMFIATPFKNALSGIIIMATEYVEIDDYVRLGDGVAGEIKAVDLFYTTIKGKGGVIHKIPNEVVIVKDIAIRHHGQSRPIFLNIEAPMSVPAERISEIVEICAIDCKAIAKSSPKPRLHAKGFSGNAITYEMIAYALDDYDYDKARSKLIELIQKKFIEENITLGFK